MQTLEKPVFESERISGASDRNQPKNVHIDSEQKTSEYCRVRQSRARMDANWKFEDHGRENPLNIRVGAVLKELLEYREFTSAEVTTPPLEMNIALVTEAGLSRDEAARTVALRNKSPEIKSHNNEWQRWRQTRYLSVFDEESSHAYSAYSDVAEQIEDDAYFSQDLQNSYQMNNYDPGLKACIPELHQPASVFRRLGQSVLVAATRVSYAVAAFRV